MTIQSNLSDEEYFRIYGTLSPDRIEKLLIYKAETSENMHDRLDNALMDVHTKPDFMKAAIDAIRESSMGVSESFELIVKIRDSEIGVMRDLFMLTDEVSTVMKQLRGN